MGERVDRSAEAGGVEEGCERAGEGEKQELEEREELEERFGEVRREQLGAFTRMQANAHGVSDRALAWRCRSGRIQRIYRGVYLDFTGPVPWETRVWAAWLAYGPDAALGDETALRKHGLKGDWAESPIRLEIPHTRRARRQPGIVITRRRDLDQRVLGSRDPSIVRLEVALLTVASRRSKPEDAIALLLEACRQRRTTPERLLDELRRLPRLPRRDLLIHGLQDASDGVESFLELVYLRRVERAHGLPTGKRQLRADRAGKPIYRDVVYEEFGVFVELDGRVGHEDATSRWRDMARDNAALLESKLTLRFGYQLVSDPCTAAAQTATLLRLRGWSGSPKPCGPTCTLAKAPVLGNAAHTN
jgi:hypothetical protein